MQQIPFPFVEELDIALMRECLEFRTLTEAGRALPVIHKNLYLWAHQYCDDRVKGRPYMPYLQKYIDKIDAPNHYIEFELEETFQ